ncbi:MAG: flagellar biosynthesis protein FlgD [Cypionkella sp.]|jgi:flagellar basal-body rod modification protein FlgD|nr:flagellar biosynthesis protein FlgD [Cypionkella sp.]
MIETMNRTGLPLREERASAAPREASDAMLNQQDFLTLMTAQLRNQDPLKPMESGEFLAQMAQFSTVAGIEKVNDTLTDLSGGLRESRMATAANLLGQQVLVPGSLGRPDDAGVVHGVVEVPEAAQDVIVTYADPATGEILHSEALGPQGAGLVGFSWPGMPPEMVASRSAVRIGVSTIGAGGQMTELPPSVYARVLSARAGAMGSDDVTLQIEDYGALNALEVEAFR